PTRSITISETMLKARRAKAVQGAFVKIVGRIDRMSLGDAGAASRGFVATERPILRGLGDAPDLGGQSVEVADAAPQAQQIERGDEGVPPAPVEQVVVVEVRVDDRRVEAPQHRL